MIHRLSAAVLGVCLASSAAVAASPEADYLAARDKAIAAVKKMEAANVKVEKIDAAQKTWLADLAKRLSAAVGPVNVDGFPKTGKLIYDSLSTTDLGSGGLDALSFANDDTGPRLIATTRGLLDSWLRVRAAEKDAAMRLPADETAAFARDDFFTSAIGLDSTFATIADLHIAGPAGADSAIARLGGWAQEDGPNPNQSIEIVVVKGGRALFVDAAAKSPVPKVPVCEQIWTAADAAWDKFMKVYDAAKTQDEKAFEAASAKHSKGFSDYRACLVQRLPKEPGFDKLVAEAQGYVDKLGQ